ncbi:zf-TFIIB domain-containing protein [Bacillus sp. AS_3]|uniref:Uncharacterized protein n=1 Tax=Bacillus cereus TaxID=1396 RepID=A0A9X8NWJ4_BACCE|nr:hypothetical protein DR116_0006775 [Bacillus cereus]
MSNVSRCCLVCDHQIKTYQSSKDEYQEVTVCPKCNGAFVDKWKLEKYKQRLEEFGELVSNSTEKDCGEATLSVLNKMIDSLLEGNQSVENNETIQNQATEA